MLKGELKKLKDALIAEVRARETAAAKAVRVCDEDKHGVAEVMGRLLRLLPSTSKRTRTRKRTSPRSRSVGVSK